MIDLRTGDAVEQLRTLPAESVQCVVTSPPYYGLRDYGVPRQIGLEPTIGEYLDKLVTVFREVRRVLRSDGVCFVNMGDSYASGGRKTRDPGNSRLHPAFQGDVATRSFRPADGHGIKPKDLLGIPWRLAFALQQPHHYGPIKRESDRAWLAALIDGEGTIGIKRDAGRSNGGTGECQPGYSVYLSIGNQDRELLDRCVEITGYGSVGVKDRPAVDGRGIRSRRTYYGWWICANQAVAVLRDVYPYLIAKKRQAVLGYNLDLSNKRGKTLRGNGPLPASEQEHRELLKVLCNACNQRQLVDLPLWLVEPPSNFEQGWWLRQDIVWSKKNPMPESVRDRCTKSHEYIFLLSKSERYFFDADAISEPASVNTNPRRAEVHGAVGRRQGPPGNPTERKPVAGWMNGKGSHDTRLHAASQKYRNEGEEHRTKAGLAASECKFKPRKLDLEQNDSAYGLDKSERMGRGAGWRVRKLADAGSGTKNNGSFDAAMAVMPERRNKRSVWTILSEPYPDNHFAVFPSELPRLCILAGSRAGDTILDPFAGSGTTLRVALELGRQAIGVELNAEYVKLIDKRLSHTTLGLPFEVAA